MSTPVPPPTTTTLLPPPPATLGVAEPASFLMAPTTIPGSRSVVLQRSSSVNIPLIARPLAGSCTSVPDILLEDYVDFIRGETAGSFR